MTGTRGKLKVSAKLQRALDDFPRLIKEQKRNFQARERDIRRFDDVSKQLLKEHRKPKPIEPTEPIHPWRLCPYGRHWVRTHELRIPAGKLIDGAPSVIRHEHCALNPNRKDHIYHDEIQKIATSHFADLADRPCGIDLGSPHGTKYDDLIAGWTKYWNDILTPEEHLKPNLIKALISSESQFRANVLANPKNANSARGLMQITNDSRKILGDTKGELKDHYVTVTREELDDPNVNICVGIRWLFQKRFLLSRRLKRTASWMDTVADYKATSVVSTIRANELMARFKKIFDELEQC